MIHLFFSVGTKSEQRHDEKTCERLRRWNSPPPISPHQGSEMAHDIGAVRYLECDAQVGLGLKNVFDCVIMTGLFPRRAKKVKSRGSFQSLLCWTADSD